MLDELKTANKIVGIKQSIKAIQTGKVKKAFIAKDAEEKVTGHFKELCQSHSVPIEYVNTMKELGKACDITVGAAVAVIVSE
ncbi:ribosomal L7Ae/L30e/S12e/Gadd45 family protein [Petroclostridium sp. X23]|jgi:large subunit ribosomal protein L7A|uniref:L7Ae/L30e/S12e/Gadd45 family ribosomal protein n=1 Tax=Petroclostridium sp. X23 TaxID=3045146 RepID=UPI0024AD503F|nr:ribosomal L7Ae/L30e/S12e/Gadd45 family protein [Petroclostridium sp. X23]WHH61715.1 ribosomal L7Ae/L30e/S12e/Gadd45 family protein [Petroclostridium sp. X23]